MLRLDSGAGGLSEIGLSSHRPGLDRSGIYSETRAAKRFRHSAEAKVSLRGGNVKNRGVGLGVQSMSKVPNWDFRGTYHIDLLGA